MNRIKVNVVYFGVVVKFVEGSLVCFFILVGLLELFVVALIFKVHKAHTNGILVAKPAHGVSVKVGPYL